MLTPRQQQILSLIVQLYGEQKEPVGSNTLLRNSVLTVSPATIRNDMKALEHEGLLVKAHTSSGRIPSKAGYHYYVNQLISKHEQLEMIDSFDESQINGVIQELISKKNLDPVQLAQTAADILVSMTGYTAFVHDNTDMMVTIKEFRFVYLNDAQIIGVLLTDQGHVVNHLFDLEESLTANQIRQMSHLLHDELEGLSLDEAKRRMKITIPLLMQRHFGKQFDFLPLITSALNQAKGQRYLVVGKYNLLDSSVIRDNKLSLKDLLNFIDESQEMDQLLAKPQSGAVEVIFGYDFGVEHLAKLSLIKGTYTDSQQNTMTIGLLGPHHMSYHRIIYLMNQLVTQLSKS